MSDKPIPVSVVRCSDYGQHRVREALRQALKPLGGMAAFVSPGNRVLLKPNLLSAKPPEKAVTTHPEIFRAVAREVTEAGGKVSIGDSPGYGSLASVLRRTGIGPVAEDLGIEVVPFATPAMTSVPEGGIYRSLELAGEVKGFDAVINLPKLKTHGQMTLTLAVKNLFGAVVGAAKPGWHLRAGDEKAMADLLLDICLTVAPALNVLDGVLAMEGNGPGSGDPRPLELLAVSPSAVAMDQVVGRLLRVPVNRHPVVFRARERGIAGAEPHQASLTGLTEEEAAVTDLVLPRSLHRIDFSLPGPLAGPLRRSMTSFPALDPVRCTSCGICVEVCPTDAITLYTGSGGGEVDRDRCISCFCCQEMCPEGAMEPVPGRLLRVLRTLGVA